MPNTLPYRVTPPTVSGDNFSGMKAPYTGINYDPTRTGAIRTADQFNTFYWIRKALTEARKEQYFTQLASTITMP